MELHDYINEHRPFHQNNIELLYWDDLNNYDGAVHISCYVPGFEEKKLPELNLSVHFDTLTDFIYEFMITEVSDVDAINPESLYKRFKVGRANLYCTLDGDSEFQLKFRWEKNKLIATRTESFDNNGTDTHEVPQYVKTPEEIIVYTKHFINKEIEAM